MCIALCWPRCAAPSLTKPVAGPPAAEGGGCYQGTLTTLNGQSDTLTASTVTSSGGTTANIVGGGDVCGTQVQVTEIDAVLLPNLTASGGERQRLL